MLIVKYIHSLDHVPQIYDIVEADRVKAELQEDMSYIVYCYAKGAVSEHFCLAYDSDDVVYVENSNGKTTQTIYPVTSIKGAGGDASPIDLPKSDTLRG